MDVTNKRQTGQLQRSGTNLWKVSGKLFAGCLLLLTFSVNQAYAALADCQANRPNAGSVLYLYFPTATDNNFPDDPGGLGISTSPLRAFGVSDLDAGIISDRVFIGHLKRY